MIARGCSGSQEEIMRGLEFVNYYRLSGYSYPFRNVPEDDFAPGTSFEKIWNLYRFDRRLRFLILDAVERIEIALRTRIAYHWAESSAAKKISNPQNVDNFYRRSYKKEKEKLFKELQSRYERATDDCFVHHRNVLKLKTVGKLPVWVFVELMMFGPLINLLKDGLKESVKYAVAESFGFERPFFGDFISALTLIKEARNCCAHHARVWNKRWLFLSKLGNPQTPIAPKIKFPCALNARFSAADGAWNIPKECAGMSFDRSTTLSLLAFCSYFVKKIAPQSRWQERVVSLFDEIPLPEKLRASAGFAPNWRTHPLFS